MRPTFIAIFGSFYSLFLQAQTVQTESAKSSSHPQFKCIAGTTIKGGADRWSPLSKCPANYTVTGLQRIDLTGDHKNPILHVNDFICDDSGCKAWCIGNECTVIARCCTIGD